MSAGLYHGPSPHIISPYANVTAKHNPMSFGSNTGAVRGYTGPPNSPLAASASGTLPPKVTYHGGKKLVHGSNGYGMALKPSTVEQQLPYSSMYAPIVPRGYEEMHRPLGMGAGNEIIPGNLYAPPSFFKGGNNRNTLPIPSGSEYYSVDIPKGTDLSVYAGSGYPPFKGDLSHGNCNHKSQLIGGRKTKRVHSKKHHSKKHHSKKHHSKKHKRGGRNYKNCKYRQFIGGGNIDFDNKLIGSGQYGGFIQNPPRTGNCQLKQAMHLANQDVPTSIKQASTTNNGRYYNYARQSNGGKGKKSNKKSNRKKTKKQYGGILAGSSGNPLFKSPYQLMYGPTSTPKLTSCYKIAAQSVIPAAYNSQ